MGRKNFKKQIGEIKKITREIYQMEETKNVHPNKKTRLIFFKKTFCMQRTKKLKIKKNRKLDLGGGRR